MTEFIIDGATTASSADGCASEAVRLNKWDWMLPGLLGPSHDPFSSIGLAAQQTDDIQLGTAIASLLRATR
ncbi:MAG: hypothetical protein Ct9H300mP26_0840 [Acidimicrobiales bacterium]|nr:MAG: hypothetical protein Ct9H300mP26_0840 [Acidimicrobiales bacterium]